MKFILLMLLAFLGLSTSLAQSVLPYPIIFVHGLNSGADTWSTVAINLGSDLKVFDFCLNHDGSYSNSLLANDTATIGWRNGSKSANKIYAINFNTQDPAVLGHVAHTLSNQAAIYKQGCALGVMIRQVLAIEGASKVILVGHSMGGLAIREYLQRNENGPKWWADPRDPVNGHKVALAVTIGTPHRGCNQAADLFGVDINSEALRDLKYDPNGIYLFGGNESIVNSSFYNKDVNCNGSTGDQVVGLNASDVSTDTDNPSMPLPTNIQYRWITSKFLGASTDGIVNLDRQWLYNNDNGTIIPAPTGSSDTLQTNRFHTEESADVVSIIRGLDEPALNSSAYEIGFDKYYRGYITYQSNMRSTDIDAFKFTVLEQSDVLMTLDGVVASGLTYMEIQNSVGSTVTAKVVNGSSYALAATLSPGIYYLRLTGEATPSTWMNPYYIHLAGTPYRHISTNSVPPFGGTTSGGGPYLDGSLVQVQAIPSSGWLFGSWSENGSPVSTFASYTFTAHSDRSLVANFTQSVFTPTITSGSMSPNAALPGSTIGIVYTINAPLAGQVLVAASLRLTGTIPWTISDPGHDLKMSLADGSNSGSRSFALPAAISPGTYDLLLALWQDVNNNNLVDAGDQVLTSKLLAGTLIVTSSGTVNVTIGSSPSNLLFFMQDSSQHVTPATLTWVPGVTYVVGFLNPEPGSAGIRYLFQQWGDGVTSNVRGITAPSTASNYTANFTTQYYLTMSAGSGGTVTPGSSWYNSGQTVQITATATGGNSFSGWTGSGADSYTGTTNLASVKMSGPIFEAAAFQAHINIATSSSPANGGTTSGSAPYVQGQSVTVSATPNVGYYFMNWTEGGSLVSTSASYNFIATGNRILVANFQMPGSITTTSNPTNGGTTVGAGSYVQGHPVTVNATPNIGYYFVNWTENAIPVASSVTYTFAAAGSRNLIANFQSPGFITTSSNPANGGTTNGAGSYTQGQAVTVSATPAFGFYFINWMENGIPVSTSPVYTFAASGARTLIANFQTPAFISTSSNPSDGGTTDGPGSYMPGQTVTVTAVPNAGFVFVNWTENGNQVSPSARYSFIISGSRALIANFLPSLPIQLLSFTGLTTKGGVLLCWTTISETNNYGFYVQQELRSDGVFCDIPGMFSPGGGTTLSERKYEQLVKLSGGSFRLRQVDLDGTSHYSESIRFAATDDPLALPTPDRFGIDQNYPNPFNPSTTIRFSLPYPSVVQLVVFNLLGQQVATLVCGVKEAGFHEVRFDASGLSSGVYFYRITAGRYRETRKLLMIR